MTKKVVTEMYQEMVRGKLFEGSAEVHGDKTFIVKAMCTTDENPDNPVQHDLTVQANSPEQAKKGAMLQAKEIGYKSCKPVGVDMVPNSGEELNDYGSGEDLGAEPADKTDGKVMPKDVSSELPNLDA